MQEEIVVLKNVKKEYSLGKTKVLALKGVDLNIYKGEFIAICGPSGSGKTTLLNIIGCIDKPTQGEVYILNKSTKNLSDTELSKLRNQYFGFIFQTFNLIPTLTAYENVEYPLIILGIEKQERKERVKNLLCDVSLWEYRNHKPTQLSGGQQQRVAIARALINNPKLVLADEPTANLDTQNALSILELMKKMWQKYKMTFIFSTHDQRILKFTEKIYYIEDGKIKG